MEPPQKKGRLLAAPPKHTFKLSNGVDIPQVGYGTAWFAKRESGIMVREEENAWYGVTKALELGYRHIDTGYMYGNEEHIGIILGGMMAEGHLKRDDVWITTKVCHPQASFFGLRDPSDGRTLHMHDMSMDSEQGLLDQFMDSLRRLNLGYVDLLLVHWPGPYGNTDAELGRKKRKQMWTAMERIYKAGLARCIGVSNFMIPHLKELLEYCTVCPMVNQVEIHPYLSQRELESFCKEHNVVLTAYCPLAQCKLGILDDQVLTEIATSKRTDVGQIALRWLLQRGIVVIPRSSSEVRQRSNLHCLTECPELSEAEMAKIDALNRNQHVCSDPNLIA